jgi:XTP/dITP diphosphohydrolase
MGVTLRRGTRLVIASHNEGKVREIADLLSPFGIDVVSAGQLGLAEPEETGATFAENAALKAVTAAKASGLPALADDSGLEVRALGGAPGIHSARWGGPNKDFGVAMERVHLALEGAGAKDLRSGRSAARLASIRRAGAGQTRISALPWNGCISRLKARGPRT